MTKRILLGVFMIMSFFMFAQQKPTLWLIGDSTMANKKDPEKNPEHGWGQVLPSYITEGITIKNQASNGRSSKSFRDEGRWDKVMEKLKSGDFVIIQFGHNDQKDKDSTRFTRPFVEYKANLERYIKETRAKGANPILMSSIARRKFDKNGNIVDTHKDYIVAARQVAAEQKVPFVDMKELTEKMETKYGEEGSKKLHLHYAKGEVEYYPDGKDDDTHLSELGANEVAKLAVAALSKMNTGLEKYIKK